MQKELQPQFDAIEQQRRELEQSTLALSDVQSIWTPDAATWSVRQIIEHLVLSDETVGRPLAPGAVPDVLPPARLLPRAWRRALVLGALRRGTALPLPSPEMEPPGNTPLPALLPRWAAARGDMARALDRAGAGDAPRFPHRIVGPLTGAQMLELSRIHTAYHARQMQQLQSHPAFPHSRPPSFPPFLMRFGYTDWHL